MELEVQSKYQLHSIEEESDAIDDACRGTVQGVYMQSNLDQERNFVIPRSISEQVGTVHEYYMFKRESFSFVHIFYQITMLSFVQPYTQQLTYAATTWNK
ncbi:unnamed protein product [Haemonchus placei]|uniref:Helitron helicase n=1 Tax=Haemonchus placei TaxID=6290 RepID=A0A0N4WSC0_HAEPC|nr:unnamed protein product [Haemonchus placei]